MLEISMFLDEDDSYQDKPMHEYILRYLMHHQILGASLFEARFGYGHKHHLHKPRSFGAVDEGPIMIIFIDEEEKVNTVLPHLKEVLGDGLMISKKVERI